MPLRLMAVHAHPDDEASKGAATTARYVAEGHEVMIVTCTGGEQGGILNPAMDRPEIRADLTAVRRAELAESLRILGARHSWLGFADSGWDTSGGELRLPPGCFADLPLSTVVEPLVRLVRQFRPHVIVTYDEIGGYPHPDHIRCHEISVAAFDAAANARSFPYAGTPWQPLKLYYVHEWCGARMQAFHDALLARRLDSPYEEWLREFDEKPDRITTRVPCGEYFAHRDRALLAHATQIDPNSHWFAVPLELQREVWPTEDYELARSEVAVLEGEDDLFAGIVGEGV